MQERRFALLGKNHDGFTLMELMIVVAVVAILAAIALPSYASYVRKARRADATQYLMTVAQLNQQRFLDTRAYATTFVQLGVTTPSSVSSYYSFDNPEFTVDAGPPANFFVRAIPSGDQAKEPCGILTLTSSGAKTSSSGSNCW